MQDQVSIRAAYERFPAAIKGAFLIRGADGLPHQVKIDGARANELAGGRGERIAIEPAVLEVAPTMDTFVPFEVPTLDLAPGWYRLECDVVVDGTPAEVHPAPPFAIAWPRSAVRRGSVPVRATAGGVEVEAVECAGDSIRIPFRSPAAPSVRLTVDDEPHPIVEIEHDELDGSGRILGYPAPRAASQIGIQVKGESPIVVRLR